MKKAFRVFYKMAGNGKIESAMAVRVDGSGPKAVVRFEDGGWNRADACFFTADQCRRHHRLKPESFVEKLNRVADKLENLAASLRSK